VAALPCGSAGRRKRGSAHTDGIETEKNAGIKGRIQLAAHRKCRCWFLSSSRVESSRVESSRVDSYRSVSVRPVSFTISSNINAAEVQILQRTVRSKVEVAKYVKARSTSRSVYYYRRQPVEKGKAIRAKLS